MTTQAEMTHIAHAPEAEKSFVRKYVFSIDHKVIGKQFLFSSLLFFVVGGLLALLMRTQLAWPWEEIPVVGGLVYGNSGNILAPEAYPALGTMHGTIMILDRKITRLNSILHSLPTRRSSDLVGRNPGRRRVGLREQRQHPRARSLPGPGDDARDDHDLRSEDHTSELHSPLSPYPTLFRSRGKKSRSSAGWFTGTAATSSRPKPTRPW